MNDDEQDRSVEAVLDTLARIENGSDEVSVQDVVTKIGDDAFAPIMLVPALVMVSPASGVPGLSTVCGIIIVLVAVQLVFGRSHLWLPAFVLRRRIKQSTLRKAASWLKRPAALLDRITGERLLVLVTPPGHFVPAGMCLAIACFVPILEFVPFSASVAGGAISFFALGLFARDGLLVLIGMIIAAGAIYTGVSVAG